MTRVFAFLACLCLAEAVVAQPIVVRSGEHDGFSRLVLKLPDGIGWRLSRNGRRVALSLDGSDVEMDLSQLFERIPRTRLASASQPGPGGPLNLDLNCDCPAQAHVDAGRLLIVDIHDPAGDDVPAPKRDDAGLLAQRFDPSQGWLPERIGALSPADPPHLMSGSTPVQPVEFPADVTFGQPGEEALDAPGAGLPGKDLAEDLNLSELRLLEQVGRATRQGLLTPRVPATHMGAAEGGPRDPAGTDHSSAGSRSRDRDGHHEIDVQRHVQLSAVTSSDRDGTPSNGADQQERGRACVPARQVAISDWGTAGGISTLLGSKRAELFSETGGRNAPAHVELARLYVYFGFGVEALRLLQSVDGADGALADMARLMDDDSREGGPLFAGQLNCRSDVALWAFLAMPQKGQAPDAQALAEDQKPVILRAFARLPDHLRRHLGPRVSARFLARGDPDAAASVLRLIDPAADGPPEGTGLVQAGIDRDRGDDGAAVRHLRSVVDAQTDQSPEALIALLEEKYRRHAPGGEALVELAGAYVTEFGESDLGPGIRRAHVLALLLAGMYAEAFKAVRGISEADPGIFRDSYSDAVADLVARADDMTFLTVIHEEIARGMPALPVSVGNDAARRLIGLGFARAAESLVASPLSARRTADRRLIWARIALAGNQPEAAVSELTDVPGTEAEELRAQAYLQLGDYRRAVATLADNEGNGELVSRARWLNDSQPVNPVDPDGGEIVGATGRYRNAMKLGHELSNAEALPDGPATLAGARSLLQASDLTQERIRSLLASVPGPDMP